MSRAFETMKQALLRLSSLSCSEADARLVSESMLLIDACNAVGVELPPVARAQFAAALLPIHVQTGVALKRERMECAQCAEFIRETCEQLVLQRNVLA